MSAEADRTLERRIERATMRLACAKNQAARRKAWDELRTLIDQRSPAQVARMEHERGLS